jgi:DNA-binding NarL/FixJ family response regulator
VTSTRVLIVDDNPAFRAAARMLLNDAGFAIAGEAETGSQTLNALRAIQPDVILLDVGLPDMSGIEVCRIIRQSHPEIAIVLCSVNPPASGTHASDCGARGYITKDEFSVHRLLATLTEST